MGQGHCILVNSNFSYSDLNKSPEQKQLTENVETQQFKYAVQNVFIYFSVTINIIQLLNDNMLVIFCVHSSSVCFQVNVAQTSKIFLILA